MDTNKTTIPRLQMSTKAPAGLFHVYVSFTARAYCEKIHDYLTYWKDIAKELYYSFPHMPRNLQVVCGYQQHIPQQTQACLRGYNTKGWI